MRTLFLFSPKGTLSLGKGLYFIKQNPHGRMSLGIIIKAPEGIVLAAESRVTLTMRDAAGGGINVNFDNATKLLNFNPPNVYIGAVTYGQAAIGIRTAHSFIPEFETTLNQEKRLTVQEFTKKMSEFFMRQWEQDMPKDYKGPNMTFNVAGYNEKQAYGKVFVFDIPRNPEPRELFPGDKNFGINWGGQREIVDRLILGYDNRLLENLKTSGLVNEASFPALAEIFRKTQLNIAIQFMPLQDCVSLALLFIRTTINAQELTVGLRGCGGAIDVAVINKSKQLRFIQQKAIVGEK